MSRHNEVKAFGNTSMVKVTSFCRLLTTGNLVSRHFKHALALVGAGFVSLTLVSCTTPAPPGEVAGFSVSEVQGGAEKGVPLRWGGTIANVVNKAETTVLEIVSRPLQRSGRPLHNDVTEGRFLAEFKGFLDPEIVSPGRDITVLGTVGRLEMGQVGEADYEYPFMSVFDYRFWKKASEIDNNSGYPHYFADDPYWLNWPHRRRWGVGGQLVF